MPTSKALYENLPDPIKSLFWNQKPPKKEEEKGNKEVVVNILQELLDKIKKGQ